MKPMLYGTGADCKFKVWGLLSVDVVLCIGESGMRVVTLTEILSFLIRDKKLPFFIEGFIGHFPLISRCLS
jgi:esterase/lipase superfamily enzyme